ncbi:DcaP family trimeric outer membrane transporter [Marinigracilibium pacificum]|uniref:Porin-like protein n=1 Tax=Marinigracilibium pacificum TaxID=2729599 RepID=A0A848J1V1_9BACT|nr:DcaP family trimeric outer membrane transporter [Marinigracilibium pacificum]NMM48289.1 hypothetical protein [Marinigracilibium pacificum]
MNKICIINRVIILCLIFLFTTTVIQAQNNRNNAIKVVTLNTSDTIIVDTTRMFEDAPLDISQDRGLFIVSPDRKMQLRILGSIRYHIVMDQVNLISENSFNTHEIPTGDDNNPIFNYSNQLSQTRLGFEVTRRTDLGDVFIRLETDFAGPDGFRIRHAYGEIKGLLLGQTWSLFSHVTSVPATVDFAGPTSSINIRTPQIRYTFRNLSNGWNLALGLEYLVPNLNFPDSINAEIFQLTPDLSARLNKTFKWGEIQVSGLLPILSGRNVFGDLKVKTGYGAAASIVVNSWVGGKWYLQSVVGRGISRYFNDLDNNVLDVLVDINNNLALPLNYGINGSYEHAWNKNWTTSFTYGILQVERYTITPPSWYFKGQTFRSNTFWSISEGAKLGIEVIYGTREDKNNETGDAFRGNILMFYDF